jgi:hypothetical protein
MPLEDRDLANVQVLVEEPRADTRADVVVRSPSWTLVIEAKVHAGEQLRQGERLARLWSSDPNPVFVFLTIDRRAMRTDPGSTWIPYSWREVASQLEASLIDAEAEPATGTVVRGRRTAMAYLDSLRHHLS